MRAQAIGLQAIADRSVGGIDHRRIDVGFKVAGPITDSAQPTAKAYELRPLTEAPPFPKGPRTDANPTGGLFDCE